ncbi:MAG: hypothetical protein HKM02_00670 [Pseudomonadales bacterium]|nr:hypothetical protein [Pseudomonadales bacterium]
MMKSAETIRVALAILVLACTNIHADSLAGGDDILSGGDDLLPDKDTSLTDNQADMREFVYGSILYNFYCGRYYSSINGILTAKGQGYINNDDGDTALLLGDIYSRIDMPYYANAVFSRIINQNTLSSIKQQTWLNKGELYYRRGQLTEAEKILIVPRDALTNEQDVKRRVILSNIYMDEGHADKASSILDNIPLDTKYSAYAYYNAGVANLRQGRDNQGMNELEKVINMPVGGDEVNAIKDKASLAIAYQSLRHHQTEQAKADLLNIRIDGPFSNPALLAMGYVHFTEHQYKKALSFWLELLKHNPADPAVQEAMMLAPRAYEELHAFPQAVFGYRLAAQTFRAELTKLEQIDYQAHQPGWLKMLDVNAQDVSRDPFAAIDTSSAVNKPETAFLYRLFSQHSFNLMYQEYMQLGNLAHEMDRQKSAIDPLVQIADLHLQTMNAHRHEWTLVIQTLSQRNDKLQRDFRQLQKRMRGFSEQSSFTDNASYSDVSRLHVLHRLEQAIAPLPDTPENNVLRERLRRVRGVVLWEVAHNAPLAFEQSRMEMVEMTDQMHILNERVAGIQQLLSNSDAFASSHIRQRLKSVGSRMVLSRQSLDAARAEDSDRLIALTNKTLKTQREFLNHQLASALLAVARLEDASISKPTSHDSAHDASPQP